MDAVKWLRVAAVLAMLRTAAFQTTYEFNQPSTRICPLVTTGPVADFMIRPTFSDAGLLNGNYSTPNIGGFQFEPLPQQCDGMCTELAVDFTSELNVGRGNFTISYTARNEKSYIVVDYATDGIYVVSSGSVLRPQADNENLLDGFLLVYGSSGPPFIFCNRTGNEVNIFSSGQISTMENPCTPSLEGMVPVRFDISVTNLKYGDYYLYVANSNCNSSMRSTFFSVSISPPVTTTTEDTSVSTSTGPAVTNAPSSDPVVIVAVVVPVIIVITIIVVVLVVLLVVFVCRHRHHRKDNEHRALPVNGNTSPLQNPSLVLQGDQTPTEKQNGHVNGEPAKTKTMKYVAFAGPEEDWCERVKKELTKLHGIPNSTVDHFSLIRADLVKKECILYILQHGNSEIISKDLHKNSLPSSSEYVRELETLGSNGDCHRNVFVVRFDAREENHLSQPNYNLLLRTEDPTSADFDHSSCAHSIYEKVREIRDEGEAVDGEFSMRQIKVYLDDQTNKIRQEVKAVGNRTQNEIQINTQRVIAAGDKGAHLIRSEVRHQGQLTRDVARLEGEEVKTTIKTEGAKIRDTVEKGTLEIQEDLSTLAQNVDKMAESNLAPDLPPVDP